MNIATSPVALAASVVAVATSLVFVGTMLRYRNDPTTRPLIGVAITLLVGALLHLGIVDLVPVREAVGIQVEPTALIGGVWILIAFDLPAVVSGLWFLFALQYTGRDRETSPITFAAVAILLVLLVGPNIVLAVLSAGITVPTTVFNALLGMTIVLSEALALIGVFLVLATTFRHRAFPAGQAALLTGAVGALLVLPFVATTLQVPAATPLSVATSGLLFTMAVHRYRVFETLPVASVVGREQVIDEMSDGVVMVGTDGRVRALNPEAESLLDVNQSAVSGRPLDNVVPALPQPAVIAESGPMDVDADSGRIVAVTGDEVTDDRGRRVGHLLVCRDVTARRRREHRLGVLTQLLAGATQQELTDVADIAGGVAAGDCSPERGGGRIHDTATEVATLVARVRDIETALADQNERASVCTDVTDVLSALRAPTDGDVSVPSTDTPLLVTGEPEVLQATLETLVTTAGTANERPTLGVEERSESVDINIAPFAPGAESSIADFSLQIARLAVDETEWSVQLREHSTRPELTISLPRAHGSVQRPGSGRESG